MAIGVRRIDNDLTALSEVLDACGVFDRVELVETGLVSSPLMINCYDEDNNKVLNIPGARFNFYYDNGSATTSTSYTYYNSIDVAYCTAKGVMFKCPGNNHTYAVILTKDNNGQPMIVFSPDENDNKYMAVRYSYSGTLLASTYNEVSGNQTCLVPFVTLINDGDARSYAPDAFWIPISENYNIGWAAVTIEGVQYVTNGHYALKDTEVV